MPETTQQRPKIAVIGLGRTGCVTGAALANWGYTVVGMDRSPHIAELVGQGRSPSAEPKLNELLGQAAKSGRLRTTTSLKEAVDGAAFCFITVGMSKDHAHASELTQLRRACIEISPLLEGRPNPLVLVVRMPVFLGAVEDAVLPSFPDASKVQIVVNPPLLRQGSSVDDFFDASLFLLGSTSQAAAGQVADLFRELKTKPVLTSLATAEFTGAACGSFHALKIAFANEAGQLAAQLRLDPNEVLGIVAQDRRLNASPAYLKPGLAFGGFHLPREVALLTEKAREHKVKMPLLNQVLPSNEDQYRRVVNSLRTVNADRIGVFGIAFRQGTDDTRGSVPVRLAEELVRQGREVRLYDPVLQFPHLHGEGWVDLLYRLPLVERMLTSDLDGMLRWSQQLVLTQRPPAEVLQRITHSGVPVMDLSAA